MHDQSSGAQAGGINLRCFFSGELEKEDLKLSIGLESFKL